MQSPQSQSLPAACRRQGNAQSMKQGNKGSGGQGHAASLESTEEHGQKIPGACQRPRSMPPCGRSPRPQSPELPRWSRQRPVARGAREMARVKAKARTVPGQGKKWRRPRAQADDSDSEGNNPAGQGLAGGDSNDDPIDRNQPPGNGLGRDWRGKGAQGPIKRPTANSTARLCAEMCVRARHGDRHGRRSKSSKTMQLAEFRKNRPPVENQGSTDPLRRSTTARKPALQSLRA